MRSFMGMCVFTVVLGLQVLIFTDMRELRREDYPFQWDVSDPRTLVVAMRCSYIVVSGACTVILLLRLHFGWLQTVNWELVCLAWLVYIIVTFPLTSWYHVPILFGKDAAQTWASGANVVGGPAAAEKATLLVMDLCLTCSCLYVPIRTHILWILPVSAFSSFAVMIAVWTPAPTSSASNVVLLAFFAFVSYQGACWNERHARKDWTSSQQAAQQTALARAMQTVAGFRCDVVVMLGTELRVCGPDQRRDAFFGLAMEGRLFADIMAEGDRVRFASFLAEASQSWIPQSMPATLEPPRMPLDAQLLGVDTGSHPRYLVGVRTEGASSPQPEPPSPVPEGQDLVPQPQVYGLPRGGHSTESEISFIVSQSTRDARLQIWEQPRS